MTSGLSPDLLAGHVAFLSGGGSGVNLGIAKVFAAHGADIAICGRTESRLEVAAVELRALGAKVSICVADVRSLTNVEDGLTRAEHELGPVSIAVCGAAGNFLAPAEAISSNGFNAVVGIDLLGSFHVARAAYAQLRATRGNILFVSGGQAGMPFAHQAHVGAAKAGVENLMRTLAVEWGPVGIRSNAILPGPVEDTEGMKRLTEGPDRAVWEQMVPLGRFASQEEIGLAAAFICSGLGSFMTGATLVVDGGLGLSGAGALNAALLAAPS